MVRAATCAGACRLSRARPLEIPRDAQVCTAGVHGGRTEAWAGRDVYSEDGSLLSVDSDDGRLGWA